MKDDVSKEDRASKQILLSGPIRTIGLLSGPILTIGLLILSILLRVPENKRVEDILQSSSEALFLYNAIISLILLSEFFYKISWRGFGLFIGYFLLLPINIISWFTCCFVFKWDCKSS